MLLNKKNKENIITGDIETLVDLDKQGLFISANESLDCFSKRLDAYFSCRKEVLLQLKSSKGFNCDGIFCYDNDIIESKILNKAQIRNQELYLFNISWALSLFAIKFFPLFVAGITFFLKDIMYPIFLLKKSYKRKKKLFFYHRNEIICHELCHIARSALNSHKYEEYFAYLISKSPLRRFLGPMFRTANEVSICTFAILLLFILQITYLFMLELIILKTIKILVVFIIVIFSFFLIRRFILEINMKRLKSKLSKICKHPEAFLFRLNDKEIDVLLKIDTIDIEIIAKKINPIIRWQVLKKRFF